MDNGDPNTNAPNYTQCTSNLIESFNSTQNVAGGMRRRPIAAAIVGGFKYVGERLAQQRELATKNPIKIAFGGVTIDLIRGDLTERLEKTIERVEISCGSVTKTAVPHVFKVASQRSAINYYKVCMLGSGSCECHVMAQTTLPCFHYLSVVRSQKEQPGNTYRYDWTLGVSKRFTTAATIAICDAAGSLDCPSLASLAKTSLKPHAPIKNSGRPSSSKRKRSHRSKDARIKSKGE